MRALSVGGLLSNGNGRPEKYAFRIKTPTTSNKNVIATFYWFVHYIIAPNVIVWVTLGVVIHRSSKMPDLTRDDWKFVTVALKDKIKGDPQVERDLAVRVLNHLVSKVLTAPPHIPEAARMQNKNAA